MTDIKKAEIYKELEKLKEEKDILILAHLYQELDVQEIADFCGDSFELARKAKSSEKQKIIFCGVKFMAESVKILCPEKHIFLPCKDATCKMADMVTAKDVAKLKELHPNAAAVCYINSSAETKSVCDMCVTSSNALRIIKNMPQKEIIFVPDKNLGSFIAEKIPEKKFFFHYGYCPVHDAIKYETAKQAKDAHKDALLLVHPECDRKVVEISDFAGSTSEIINFAKNSNSKSFIIGTEKAVCERLAKECPEKEFILLDKNLVCEDMKKTTLETLLETAKTLSGEVSLDKKQTEDARICLENMMKA